MASLINIRTTEGSLDLPKDFDNIFYVTRQIFDITDFETRNADFTKTIQAPATPRNIRILGALADIANSGEQTDNRIQCSIEMAGITIAPVAWILHASTLVTSVGTFFKLFIMYGNFNMFDQLSGQTIDKLNWADTATEWETVDLLPKTKFTYLDNDLVYPLADWNNRQSLGFVTTNQDNLIDINLTGFYLYARNIIERMLLEANYTLIVGTVPADFNTIALACPVTKFFDVQEIDGLSLAATVHNNATQSVVGVTERAVYQIQDTGTIWNTGTNEFTVGQNLTDLTVKAFGTINYVRGHPNNPPSRIVIFQNAVEIAAFSQDVTALAVDYFITVQVNAIANDVFYVELQADNTNAPATIDFLADNKFELFTAGQDVTRLVQPSEHIPQITQSTFLANILKLFNLFMVTNDIEHTVTINSFDTIYQNTEIDLSNRIAGGKNDAEIANSIASIGQQTSLKWQEDNLLRRDANTTIEFNNQILAKEVTVIDMVFSACDNSILYYINPPDVNRKAKNPMVSLEAEAGGGSLTWGLISVDFTTGAFSIDDLNEASEVPVFQVGDYFWMTNLRFYRVITKNSDKTGFFQLPVENFDFSAPIIWIYRASSEDFEPRLAILLEDVQGVAPLYDLMQGTSFVKAPLEIGSLTASWLPSLKMSEIAATYYANIFNALQSPSIIKTKFNLSVVELSDWDFTRPVYISQFNAYYYLNKINQFKINNLTQLELVRISYVATEAIDPPDPPPPDQFKAHIIQSSPTTRSPISTIEINTGSPVSPVGFATFIAGDTITMKSESKIEPDTGFQWIMSLINVGNSAVLGTWILTTNILRTESLVISAAPSWDGGDVEFQTILIAI